MGKVLGVGGRRPDLAGVWLLLWGASLGNCMGFPLLELGLEDCSRQEPVACGCLCLLSFTWGQAELEYICLETRGLSFLVLPSCGQRNRELVTVSCFLSC